MRSRLTLAALALSFAIGACNQDAPTTAPDSQQPVTELKKDKGRADLLKDLAFSNAPLFIPGGAATGQTTSGNVTITLLAYVQVTKTLMVCGSIT
jgi:hypothetical protein